MRTTLSSTAFFSSHEVTLHPSYVNGRHVPSMLGRPICVVRLSPARPFASGVMSAFRSLPAMLVFAYPPRQCLRIRPKPFVMRSNSTEPEAPLITVFCRPVR